MARKTTADVAADLQLHEVQCAERWKTAFNKFDDLEQSIEEINRNLRMSLFSLVGFLATILVALLTGIVAL